MAKLFDNCICALVAVAEYVPGLTIHEVPGVGMATQRLLILQRVRCPSAAATSWWAWLAGNA
jgi:hypothetical protein